MREGWEAEAGNWATFARMPGHDHFHDEINLPALRDLLPRPVGVAAAPGERRWQRIPLALHLRAVKPG
jgi:hypothetical protein